MCVSLYITLYPKKHILFKHISNITNDYQVLVHKEIFNKSQKAEISLS